MKNIVLLSLLLVLAACKVDYHQSEEKASIEQKNYVKIEPVKTQTKPIPIQTIGRLGSDKELKLSFKIGGIIASLNAEEGDYVKKGMLLGSIRTNEIDAQVLKAERAVQKTKRDLDRIQKMFADSVATIENVDDLKTLLQVAQADLEIAQFNQKFAKIISPVSGRVIRRLAEPNELVAPGQPVLMIASARGNSYVMKVALSDKDINRVKYGSAAKIHFDAFPNHTFSGKVNTISESADPMTGTFELEISVDSKQKRLRNGYIGQVEIDPILEAPYLEIPIQAVIEGDQKTVSIFIPSQADSIAKEVQVEVFHITNHSVFVKQTEDNIEKVITNGAAYLMDGNRIYLSKNQN